MKIGFIGCGNMAKAMMTGILSKGEIKKEDITASDASKTALEAVCERLGITAAPNNTETVKSSDIIIMAIKPIYMEEVVKEISPAVGEKLIVTLAPGKTLSWLHKTFGRDVKIIRTMPNTPAMVGEGMAALCKNEFVSDDEMNTVKSIFESFGKAEIVPETLMDAVCGVSGSSPAFVFMFIEAMADAAVAEGMPRAQAYKFAAQSVMGSAKLVLETGKHPGELKDMVCSPGGTTIEGVGVLESMGFRASVIEAVRAATEKSKGV